MASENPTWGYTRIHGALENIGHRGLPRQFPNPTGLDNRLISGPPKIDMARRVQRHGRLGGLLNFYQRAA